MSSRRLVWLDCDPGHDDAIAILLAVHSPNLQLLGVSTCHGNAKPQDTHINSVRLLHAFNAPIDVHAHRGAIKPLLRPARTDPEIHGDDGLGGSDGLPTLEDPGVLERWQLDGRRLAIDGMAKALKNSFINGHKVCIATTGPMTNLAILLTVHPELIECIEEIVFMGGGVGIGNRGAVAEYNILCDPEAAQIVLDAPVKKTMIPLNVTHTAIFTSTIHRRLLSGSSSTQTPQGDIPLHPGENLQGLPPPATPLRNTLSAILLFFAHTYKETFNFVDGPPVHDALTIAYLSRPELFKVKRYRVDVELAGTHTVGETVVDVWNYRGLGEDSWGPDAKNCLVAESADIPEFWNIFMLCVDKCDKVTPLNNTHLDFNDY